MASCGHGYKGAAERDLAAACRTTQCTRTFALVTNNLTIQLDYSTWGLCWSVRRCKAYNAARVLAQRAKARVCRVWRQNHVQVDDNNNMMKFQGSLKDVLVLDLDEAEGGTVLLDRAETSGVPCTSNMQEVLRSMRYVIAVQVRQLPHPLKKKLGCTASHTARCNSTERPSGQACPAA